MGNTCEYCVIFHTKYVTRVDEIVTAAATESLANSVKYIWAGELALFFKINLEHFTSITFFSKIRTSYDGPMSTIFKQGFALFQLLLIHIIYLYIHIPDY